MDIETIGGSIATLPRLTTGSVKAVLYRLKATGSCQSRPEFYCGVDDWNPDRTKAYSMEVDEARDMANSLRKSRQPQPGVDYYTYDIANN